MLMRFHLHQLPRLCVWLGLHPHCSWWCSMYLNHLNGLPCLQLGFPFLPHSRHSALCSPMWWSFLFVGLGQMWKIASQNTIHQGLSWLMLKLKNHLGFQLMWILFYFCTHLPCGKSPERWLSLNHLDSEPLYTFGKQQNHLPLLSSQNRYSQRMPEKCSLSLCSCCMSLVLLCSLS